MKKLRLWLNFLLIILCCFIAFAAYYYLKNPHLGLAITILFTLYMMILYYRHEIKNKNSNIKSILTSMAGGIPIFMMSFSLYFNYVIPENRSLRNWFNYGGYILFIIFAIYILIKCSEEKKEETEEHSE